MLGRLDFFGRAGGLLALFLLLAQGHPRPASAAPRARDGGEVPPESQLGPRGEAGEAAGDELFPGVEPEALAAVLLRAIQAEGRQAQPDEEEDGARSQALSSSDELLPESEEEEPHRRQAEADRLKDLLGELRRYGPGGGEAEGAAPVQRKPWSRESPPPREAPRGEREDEALRPKAPAKRRAPSMSAGPGSASPGLEEPWSGARKLRQQQHLEHQLLQRRYEELAESRRQAEEARRAAAEEERLADLASDLLLQYLLKDGEEEEEGGEDREEEEEAAAGRRGGPLLFEDEEEANVAEDKRSNEAAAEDEEDEIDPNTIDRLIELSSQLHLPADDVVDLINEVEEKKRKKDPEPPRPKARIPPLAPPPPKPKKGPQPPRFADAAPGPSLYRAPALRKPFQPRRPKPDESAWNEILKAEDEYPAPPAWPRKLSNAISPWTFRPRPGALLPRREEQEKEEDPELENYLASVLGKQPGLFP